MSDGARFGVSAGRALKTVLGGDPPPGDDERDTMQEMEARIRSRPLPGEGKKPWQMEKDGEIDDAYSYASEIIAHAFLVIADDWPEMLTERVKYTEEDLAKRYPGEDWWKQLVGTYQDPTTVMWDEFTKRWPDGDDWIGGASGFMVGWALNAARAIKNEPPVQNPAIVTVGTKPPEPAA